jgi:tRNA threonylcarbamoyl adenosine modification protein (Sua5/YciO/YrdC/YwlC family)
VGKEITKCPISREFRVHLGEKNGRMAEYIRINPEDPDLKIISYVAEKMRQGAIVIFPTDTVYGVGCDITIAKAIEQVAAIKGTQASKANLSIVCHNLSHLSTFVRPISNTVFRVLKKYLPGPYTFILPANTNVPKVFNTKKKEVGIRVPDHLIPRLLVEKLGNPIVTTSVVKIDELADFDSDPQMIFEQFKDQIDIFIDGGYANNIPSTIVATDGDDFEIIRQGLGEFSY